MRRGPVIAIFPLVAGAWCTPARATDLVYVNRCVGGCFVTGGVDNAQNEVSSLIIGMHSFSPYSYPDTTFDNTVACIRQKLQPFDFEVVTTKPSVPHHQIILAGAASDGGFAPGTQAIAPYSPGVVKTNAIAFVLSNDVGGDAAVNCWYAAQQLGSMHGLDTEYYCPDLMGVLPTCDVTAKAFTDVDAPCGDYGARACQDPGAPATQNSYVLLGGRAGFNVVFADGFE